MVFPTSALGGNVLSYLMKLYLNMILVQGKFTSCMRSRSYDIEVYLEAKTRNARNLLLNTCHLHKLLLNLNRNIEHRTPHNYKYYNGAALNGHYFTFFE